MKRIMIEIDKCDGCKNCAIACMQAHREVEGSIYTLNLSDPRNESRNFVLLNAQGQYVPLFCRHCDEPECEMSCTSGALTKDKETGHIYYDEEQCGACFICVMNCPFGLPKPDRFSHSKVIKCDFCRDNETGPNCVRLCPKKAISVKEVASS
ncbi:MAG: nitrate reductase [Clostridiales bacterium]|nr:nitrate reductase [Clostridiales bacterium]